MSCWLNPLWQQRETVVNKDSELLAQFRDFQTLQYYYDPIKCFHENVKLQNLIFLCLVIEV